MFLCRARWVPFFISGISPSISSALSTSLLVARRHLLILSVTLCLYQLCCRPADLPAHLSVKLSYHLPPPPHPPTLQQRLLIVWPCILVPSTPLPLLGGGAPFPAHADEWVSLLSVTPFSVGLREVWFQIEGRQMKAQIISNAELNICQLPYLNWKRKGFKCWNYWFIAPQKRT